MGFTTAASDKKFLKSFVSMSITEKKSTKSYILALRVRTRNPAKASSGRPYETGSRNMAATKK